MAAGCFKVLAAATLIMAVVTGCAKSLQEQPPAQSGGSGATAQVEQPKQRVAVLPSVGDLDPQRLILLTDKVREIATDNLPRDNFNILKQDKIIQMIGEEELYRSCKEGVCIGDLAKKTNANYGARCDVIKLDNSLVMKFELYSVNEEAIFKTFTDYNVNDFHGMLSSLEARLPDVFKEMVSAYKSREVTPKPEPAKPKPTPTPAVAASQPKPAFDMHQQSVNSGAAKANVVTIDKNKRKAEELTAEIYTLLEKNNIKKAYQLFQKYRKPLSKFLDRESYQTLELTLTQSYNYSVSEK